MSRDGSNYTGTLSTKYLRSIALQLNIIYQIVLGVFSQDLKDWAVFALHCISHRWSISNGIWPSPYHNFCF